MASIPQGIQEEAVELVEEKPYVFVFVAIALLAAAIFWKSIVVFLRGLFFASIAIILLFSLILVWAKIKYRQPSLRNLYAEKKRLLEAIKIAEKRYMKRRLSEKDFNQIFKEKQRKLISVEALIDRQQNRERKEKAGKELLAVQAKKRHILKSLLEEKRRVLKEMDIAEKSYLKRKIDAKTYQEFVQSNQHTLIELEADIKQLYQEANVSKVMEKLKTRLSELESPTRKKRKRKFVEREKLHEIAKEISDQVKKK